MKKCPYCAEKIQSAAIKCKHCGEWLKDKRQVDFRTSTGGCNGEKVLFKIEVIDTNDFKEKCVFFSDRRIVVARMSVISGLSALAGYPGVIINSFLSIRKNSKIKLLSLDEVLLKHKNNYWILNEELVSIAFLEKERKGVGKWALQKNRKIILSTQKEEHVFRIKPSDGEKIEYGMSQLKDIFQQKLILIT